ncbi:MAG: hypothetical protein IJT48_12080 [Bacteroidaceae bacterium]|nr:hypothetical protein [Bacteroidaceae bacterium]
MIKTYQLTTPARNSSFVLRGKTNNAQRFNFSGGDPMTGKYATLSLQSKYSQDLLEGSDLFKQGYVKLLRVDDGGETPVAGEPQRTVVEEVTSPEQLIEYVASTLEKVYQRPEAALNYAKQKGYEFPNVKLDKE